MADDDAHSDQWYYNGWSLAGTSKDGDEVVISFVRPLSNEESESTNRNGFFTRATLGSDILAVVHTRDALCDAVRSAQGYLYPDTSEALTIHAAFSNFLAAVYSFQQGTPAWLKTAVGRNHAAVAAFVDRDREMYRQNEVYKLAFSLRNAMHHVGGQVPFVLFDGTAGKTAVVSLDSVHSRYPSLDTGSVQAWRDAAVDVDILLFAKAVTHACEWLAASTYVHLRNDLVPLMRVARRLHAEVSALGMVDTMTIPPGAGPTEHGNAWKATFVPVLVAEARWYEKHLPRLGVLSRQNMPLTNIASLKAESSEIRGKALMRRRA